MIATLPQLLGRTIEISLMLTVLVSIVGLIKQHRADRRAEADKYWLPRRRHRRDFKSWGAE